MPSFITYKLKQGGLGKDHNCKEKRAGDVHQPGGKASKEQKRGVNDKRR
jgi:hypothetical protein